ncbi:uncharacterized protein LOC133190085 [Saccostrea echinata]|uniref:uncharacterized protein LOC133190085 n=1 Tax=Saccostrea echinata TaxID=191078 RepID=UPI002A804120|nr:uncharacterized protein LOC133190085 [Saccostrea echinata]
MRKFGCSGLSHSHVRFGANKQTDEEILTYLEKEIKEEADGDALSDKFYFTEWKLAKAESEITMTKKLQSETITVIFNVNDSLEDNYDEYENVDLDGPPMSSRPSFVVEIAKPSGIKMMISCECVSDQESLDSFDKNSTNADQIEITSVQVYKGERLPTNFVCQKFDEMLYEKLLNVLEERNINNQFVSELISYSTVYEHQLYVDFLKKMKRHLSEK